MPCASLMSTYKPLPVSFNKGEGVWLWDTQGKKYLDALSGIGVCNIGHTHPAITKAISTQAQQLIHTSNLYTIENQERLAERLVDKAGMDSAFFSNSGAEANEAAIKLARLYGHQKGIDTPSIIVMENSFHGRTIATLSATGNRKVQAGFEPLVGGFVRAPYNDMAAIETIANNNRNVVAVLVEPVQGEAGINIPNPDYLEQLRTVCDQNGWLLMLDEIQTGMGRTGKYFAYQHSNVIPDVMTVAKALGNGVPIGACLARGDAAKVFQPGTHGSTFGGNPLACAASLAVMQAIEDDKLVANAATMGEYLQQQLKKMLEGCDSVVEIRSLGLMVAIELNKPCTDLVQHALDKGVLINVTAEKVVRLLPPLIINTDQIDHLVDTLNTLIRQF